MSVICGLKVYQGPKSIEDFQHNMGTVFCHNNSVYEWIEKSTNGHTSVTHEGAGRPSTATTDDIERVFDMVPLDRGHDY